MTAYVARLGHITRSIWRHPVISHIQEGLIGQCCQIGWEIGPNLATPPDEPKVDVREEGGVISQPSRLGQLIGLFIIIWDNSVQTCPRFPFLF